jgi:EmrB/QacA subfamily drug resistance transporter
MSAVERAAEGGVTAEMREARSPWQAFAVLAIGVFLAVLDLFIVNIAFPAIQSSFPLTSLSSLSWILSAYAIVFAAVLIPAGKLGDIVGRKRVFLAGLLIFLTGSALAAASPSVDFLIGARILQAVGGAALIPTSLGLILPVFPAQKRPTVIGLWAALAGVGAAAGPPIGGLLVEASWRWIFLINLPLGLFALVRSAQIVPEIRDPEGGRFPDLLGSLLLMVAIGSLTLGLVKGPDWSWDGRSLGAFAVSAVMLALFTLRSARHPAPVVELSLLRPPAFALSALSALLFFAAFAVLLLANVLFLTNVWEYSILEAGLAFFPGPLTAAVVAGLSGRRGGQTSSPRIGAAGGIIFALSSLWFLARLGDQPDYLSAYLPGAVVGGVGVGLVLPALTALATGTLPPARLATGIGVQTTFRQIGAALGLASFVAIVGTSALATKSDFDGSWLFMAIASAAAGIALTPLFRPRPRARAVEPQSHPGQVLDAVVETTIEPPEAVGFTHGQEQGWPPSARKS